MASVYIKSVSAKTAKTLRVLAVVDGLTMAELLDEMVRVYLSQHAPLTLVGESV